MDPAWLVAAVTLMSVLGGVILWAGRWAWRLGNRIIRFLDDYLGEPARSGVPERPGVMARMARFEQLLGHVLAETQPNHGTSLRDAVNRVESEVTQARTDQAEYNRRLERVEAALNVSKGTTT